VYVRGGLSAIDEAGGCLSRGVGLLRGGEKAKGERRDLDDAQLEVGRRVQGLAVQAVPLRRAELTDLSDKRRRVRCAGDGHIAGSERGNEQLPAAAQVAGVERGDGSVSVAPEQNTGTNGDAALCLGRENVSARRDDDHARAARIQLEDHGLTDAAVLHGHGVALFRLVEEDHRGTVLERHLKGVNTASTRCHVQVGNAHLVEKGEVVPRASRV